VFTVHKGPEKERIYSYTLSLASALDWVGSQRRAPAALPQERAGTHCMGVRGGALRTALQAGSMGERFPMMSFEFLIDIVFPSAL